MTAPLDWFAIHANLITLTKWLSDRGYGSRNVVDAVAKPWKYDDEWAMAEATTSHEAQHDHTVYYGDDFDAYCNDCGEAWKVEDARQAVGWCRCGAKTRLFDDGSHKVMCEDCHEERREDARQEAQVARAEQDAELARAEL